MKLRGIFTRTPDAQHDRRGALKLPGWLRRRQAPEGEIVIDPLKGAMRMTPWGPQALTPRQRRAHEKRMAEHGRALNRRERREGKPVKVGTPAQRRAFGARMCHQARLIRYRGPLPAELAGRTDLN